MIAWIIGLAVCGYECGSAAKGSIAGRDAENDGDAVSCTVNYGNVKCCVDVVGIERVSAPRTNGDAVGKSCLILNRGA